MTTQLVRVYFNDMSFKTFAIAEDVTAGELCDMFAKKMRLKDTTVRHFTLNVVINGQPVKVLGNILGRPYQEQKEYLAKSIGWGASNQNCFLFTLRAETAKRMSAALSNPHRREISGSIKGRKPQERAQTVNGRRVIAATQSHSHVANAGVPEDPSTHHASPFPSHHPSNPSTSTTPTTSRTIGSNRTRSEPQPVVVVAMQAPSTPTASASSPYEPFPLASSASTPPMPSLLNIHSSPSTSSIFGGSPPKPRDDTPVDASSPDQSVLTMLDKAKNNVVPGESPPTGNDEDDDDPENFAEYQDLIKVLAQLSK